MKRSLWVLIPAALVIAILAISGIGKGSPPETGPEQATGPEVAAPGAVGFSPWHSDFPLEVPLSPDAGGRWYDRSRTQALERIVAKLQGNCTRSGWLMAKEFFSHGPEQAVGLLVRSFDRAFQARELADLVENTVEAMGRVGRFHSPQISDALLRALEHPRMAVREKAMQSLVLAGSAEAVRRAQPMFTGLSGRAQNAWVRAVRVHMPEEAVGIFLHMLGEPRLRYLVDHVMAEAMRLPKEQALQIAKSFWPHAPPEELLAVATILHAGGDVRGTRLLQTTMRNGQPQAKAMAIGAAMKGGMRLLMDDILKLSLDESSGVRQAVVLAIAKVPGTNITNTLETLALDPSTEVRQPALRALRERGKRALLDRLIEVVASASGTRLRQALADLSAAGDDDAIPAMFARYREAPPGEARMFLQAIGRSRAAAALEPLAAIFKGPEKTIDLSGKLTTVTYTGVLFANFGGHMKFFLDLFEDLDGADYRRRAVLLQSLGNLAGVSKDLEAKERVFAKQREIAFDSHEIPQMRLLALQYLRKDISLDDMMRLKKMQRTEEDEAMRKAITNFLFEFF